MGPNGYRSFMFPGLAIACAAIAVPPPPPEKRRTTLVEDVLAYRDINYTTAGYYNRAEEDERRRRINARGIPYPETRRHRRSR